MKKIVLIIITYVSIFGLKAGKYSLSQAITLKDTKKVLELINNVVDINQAIEYRQTYLNHAVSNSTTHIVKILLNKGADINMLNGNGLSALHVAALTDNVEMARLLISRGADMNILNNRQLTPIFLGILSNHIDITRFLLQQGASTTAGDVDEVEWNDLSVEMRRLLIANGIAPHDEGYAE